MLLTCKINVILPSRIISISKPCKLHVKKSVCTFSCNGASIQLCSSIQSQFCNLITRSGSDGQLLDSIPKISSQEKRTSAGTPAPSICSICSVHQQQFAVKFPCCSEYFHSFLCHNLSESCPKKDLRPFDAQFLKCLDCKGNQKVSLQCSASVRYSLLHSLLSRYFIQM